MKNKYCKKCRKYSAIDVYCQEISNINYTVKPDCYEAIN
jgi:hypothetical protein